MSQETDKTKDKPEAKHDKASTQTPPQPTPPQPVAQPATVPTQNPGETTGIIGIVSNFLGLGLVGLILGIVSFNQSKKAGASTVLGIINIVWGVVSMLIVISIIGFFFLIAILSATSY